MKTRSMAAAFAVAALLTGLGVTSASAAPPEEVAIQIVPTFWLPCGFTCGTWTANGAINDIGTYVTIPTEGRTPKPGSGFVLGPFKEAFLLTSSRGSFTIKAEEMATAVFVSHGVFQLEARTGAYASASGHGEAASAQGRPALLLDGVAKIG
jgi:hypothetical protein